jgi:hypothetical protein
MQTLADPRRPFTPWTKENGHSVSCQQVMQDHNRRKRQGEAVTAAAAGQATQQPKTVKKPASSAAPRWR